MPLTNPKLKSIFSLNIGITDYSTDITAFRLYSEPLDQNRITFSKYEQGSAVRWFLEVDAVFDGGSAGSLHDFLWMNAGQQAQFTIRPFQEFDPDTKRFYLGSIRMESKPDILVSAGRISTYTYTFKVIGQPSRSDQPGGFLTGDYYSDY